jgi:hypothetical protein
MPQIPAICTYGVYVSAPMGSILQLVRKTSLYWYVMPLDVPKWSIYLTPTTRCVVLAAYHTSIDRFGIFPSGPFGITSRVTPRKSTPLLFHGMANSLYLDPVTRPCVYGILRQTDAWYLRSSSQRVLIPVWRQLQSRQTGVGLLRARWTPSRVFGT